MKTTLKWRFKNLPTVDEIAILVKDGIITKEEAREILVSEQTDEDRDKESLKSEIKFLRELVETLSRSRTTIIEKIKEIERPYKIYPWYDPYKWWCTTTTDNSVGSIYMNAMNSTSGSSTSSLGMQTGLDSSGSKFSSIKTF